MQAVDRQTQNRGRPIGAAFRPSTDQLASGLLVAGTESQPAGEVFDGLPAGHVGPDLADELQHGMPIQSRDLRQVHTGDTKHRLPHVEPRFVAMRRALAGFARQASRSETFSSTWAEIR